MYSIFHVVHSKVHLRVFDPNRLVKSIPGYRAYHCSLLLVGPRNAVPQPCVDTFDIEDSQSVPHVASRFIPYLKGTDCKLWTLQLNRKLKVPPLRLFQIVSDVSAHGSPGVRDRKLIRSYGCLVSRSNHTDCP